ncbi:MAG: hypothetical protein DMG89_20295 [Acidobacteria bacterium]|nr:MAG: hypothetical protein DMG89_20295 [Acidobacteriota bacterium]
MVPDPTHERQKAHELLDLLSIEKVAVVRSLLEVMMEPLSKSLNSVPLDDEEVTKETAAAIEEARASLARSEGIPHDEVLREFGIKK